MAKARTHDHAFEISFFESVLGRDPAYTEVVEIGLASKKWKLI